jgi:hypothetical protein
MGASGPQPHPNVLEVFGDAAVCGGGGSGGNSECPTTATHSQDSPALKMPGAALSVRPSEPPIRAYSVCLQEYERGLFLQTAELQKSSRSRRRIDANDDYLARDHDAGGKVRQ